MMRRVAGKTRERRAGGWPAASRVVFAILASLLLAGCNAFLTAGAVPSASVSAGKTPAATGAAEHARIVAAYGGIYHDEKLQQNAGRIVGRVVAASDRPDQTYSITILNAPAVNAFA